MAVPGFLLRLSLVLWLLVSLSGCVAVAVTSAVVGVAVEIIEVPFEVAGAVYDVATDDDDDDDDDDEDD